MAILPDNPSNARGAGSFSTASTGYAVVVRCAVWINKLAARVGHSYLPIVWTEKDRPMDGIC